MKKIELLAPAGSYEALVAAVQNGCDAVYLAGKAFGARAYATNFDKYTMQKAIEYAHIRGVKVYLTVNILVKDNEREDLLKYVLDHYNMGIDAVIVQDLGVVKILQDNFKNLEIHSSTQMTIHNTEGVNALYNRGIKRVVLARELNTEEINNIAKHTKADLEVFVHGALCYSYSGQCLMSSFIGGRSGNRGRCAQPCRKKYKLVKLNRKTDENQKLYYISMRDLNTLENVGKIIDSGVLSLKIEGRMKRPEYVVSIVRAYRKAIDKYISTNEEFNDSRTTKEITQVFNRKFTKGFILDSDRNQILNIEKPNNRGLVLGKVQNYNSRRKLMTLKLMEDINQGDGIEIWDIDRGSVGGIINKIYKNNKLSHYAKKGDIVDIEINSRVNPGEIVYKTLDNKLMKELARTYEENNENKKIPIWAKLEVKLGEPLKLYIWDNEYNTIYKESENIVEEAINRPITEERIKENLGKLGNTPFYLESINIKLDSNVAIAISAINKIRRDAIESLTSVRKNKNKGDKKIELFNIYSNEELSLDKGLKKGMIPKITAKVHGLNQLETVLQEGVERVYFSSIKDIESAVKLCKDNNIEIYFKTPSILKDRESKILKYILKDNPINGILAGELGIIDYIKSNLNLPIILDYNINIMNSSAVKFLQNMNVDGITLSTELDLNNIRHLEIDKNLEIEVVAYGKLPMMTTEACPLINTNYCDRECHQCKVSKNQYIWGLKDNKNMIFPLTKDDWGRTIILNSQPIYMADKMEDLLNLRIHNYRLEFTDENTEEMRKIIQEYKNSIKEEMNNYQDNNRYKKPIIENFTRGHFYRGVE